MSISNEKAYKEIHDALQSKIKDLRTETTSNKNELSVFSEIEQHKKLN
jgi:hypothetical protein